MAGLGVYLSLLTRLEELINTAKDLFALHKLNVNLVHFGNVPSYLITKTERNTALRPDLPEIYVCLIVKCLIEIVDGSTAVSIS